MHLMYQSMWSPASSLRYLYSLWIPSLISLPNQTHNILINLLGCQNAYHPNHVIVRIPSYPHCKRCMFRLMCLSWIVISITGECQRPMGCSLLSKRGHGCSIFPEWRSITRGSTTCPLVGTPKSLLESCIILSSGCEIIFTGWHCKHLLVSNPG